jgi:hypothetical protein
MRSEGYGEFLSKSSVVRTIRSRSEGIDERFDIGKVLVFRSAEPFDYTLHIVPIEDAWRGQKMISGMDRECRLGSREVKARSSTVY